MKFTSTLKKNFALGLGAAVLATGIALLNPAQANAATVTVKAGDTVSELASTYKTDIATIEKDNNISSNHMIYVGQSLTVNGTTTSASQVTVKAGDTVSQIAANNNTTVEAIETLNKIVGHMIYVGQVLNMPTATATTTTSAPATTNTTSTASTYKAPAQTTTTTTSVAKTTTTSSYSSSSVSGSEASAKAIIAMRESGGNYNARNGQYIGKYQLTSSYLGGDYSAANQERVANNYVASRYGSWTKALAFWNANGWY